MTLRDYQETFNSGIEASWQEGNQNVVGVLPTGGGKTVCMAHLLKRRLAPQIAIAHRQELVGQISIALARQNLKHRIIAPAKTIDFIVQQHVEELGYTTYEPKAEIAVAGVDTLIRRTVDLSTFLKRCAVWINDEGHHLQEVNKWGRAVGFMPQALGLGLTATPLRSDRGSLKRGAGGCYDAMVIGPGPRELIDRGYLCDYRIFAPASDLDLSRVEVTRQGDFNPQQLKMATARSHMVGDVVENYLKFAAGKTGICFTVNAELGAQHVEAFNAAGVPAAYLSFRTPPAERVEIMRRLRSGVIKMLVNQDIVGEGLDIPCIEVVIMARATASYGLFVQMFGRMLRLLSGKLFGILIDHVGNVKRHGLPDAARLWTLENAKPEQDETKINTCRNPDCFRMWTGFSKICPHCGYMPKAATPGGGMPRTINEVEGDLTELTPETLAAMREEAARLVKHKQALPVHLSQGIQDKIAAIQAARRVAQEQLREAMAYWAGVQVADGMDLSTSYRKFYHKFGIDAQTAQTLDPVKALELLEKVRNATWHDYRKAS